MAALYGESPYEMLLDGDEECFYCHDVIGKISRKNPVLYWMGDPSLIVHPNCFQDLVVRMYRDLHEIQIKTNVKSIRGM